MSNVTVQEALNAAVNFIESVHSGEWSGGDYSRAEILTIIESALSEIGKCDPVGYVWDKDKKYCYVIDTDIQFPHGTKLYTSPKPREWVGLDLSEYENQGLGAIAEDICEKLKQLNTKG